jgi:hypothetical protein
VISYLHVHNLYPHTLLRVEEKTSCIVSLAAPPPCVVAQEKMDKNLLPAIIGAISGAFVAAIGWFVLHGLSSRRESAARRDNAARSYLEKQIEELYGPWLGLIEHSRTAFAVARRKLPHTASGQIDFGQFSDGDGEIWRFFIEHYFLPGNAEIRRLLRSKMHLLESGVLPRSF